jgi:hypothetical protein
MHAARHVASPSFFSTPRNTSTPAFDDTDGAKYWQQYDFIPELQSPLRDDPKLFIRHREKLMRQTLLQRYGLNLEQEPEGE